MLCQDVVFMPKQITLVKRVYTTNPTNTYYAKISKKDKFSLKNH